MGSLTYIEKLMEELVSLMSDQNSLMTEQNEVLKTLLVKSYPELAEKEEAKKEEVKKPKPLGR